MVARIAAAAVCVAGALFQGAAAYGALTFTDANAGLQGLYFNSAVWGDYDSDGDLDLCLIGRSTGNTYCGILYRNDAGTLVDSGTSLSPVSGTARWVDYDNDGDLDLSVCGNYYDGSTFVDVNEIYRNDSGVLSLSGLPMPVADAIAWADWDNDGDSDFIVAGSDTTAIYRNDGSPWTDTGTVLTGVDGGAVDFVDYDRDGDLDATVAGFTGLTNVLEVYRNDAGVFTTAPTGLPGIGIRPSASWGDYDSDGDLDVALCGYSRSETAPISRIYSNNGGTFSDTGASIIDLNAGAVSWGDCDGDGDLDLAIAGRDASMTQYCRVYLNNGGTFSDSGAVLTGVDISAIAWGDCDGDTDLDLFVGGRDGVGTYVSKIFLNDTNYTNQPPAAPTGLTASWSGSELTLNWNPAVDAETPSAGLTYSVRIGTSPGSGDVLSGGADASGYRLAPRMGNVQTNLSWTVALPPGTYHCSVQAVDNCFAGSPWCSEITAASSFGLLSPNGGEAWAIGSAQDIEWSGMGVADVKVELSRDDGATWTTLVASTPAAAGSYPWTVTGPASSSCLVRISDAAVPATSDTSNDVFSIPAFWDTGASVAAVTAADLDWGDYDGDGDLDLLLVGEDSVASSPARLAFIYANTGGVLADSGVTSLVGVGGSASWTDFDGDGDLDIGLAGWSSSEGYVARIYRNEAATFSAIGAGLAGVYYSDVAWGDYDNDGDPDLLVTGYNGGTDLYRNDGATFTGVSTPFPNVAHAGIAWGDYDNDGDLDLVISGVEGISPDYAEVYRNNGGTFSNISAGLAECRFAAAAWGDYDNDGDLDLALAGQGCGTRIYRNTAAGFVDAGAGLSPTRSSALAWGDYDNDGDLDLVVSGQSGASATRLYRNDAGAFVEIDAQLVGVHGGAVAWGDYDGDGDLDLAVVGNWEWSGDYFTEGRVYRNDVAVPNTHPASPSGLSVLPAGGTYDVAFAWGEGDDAETPVAGLTYNLRIGTTSGGDEVMSGMTLASLETRMVSRMGNVQHNLSWTIKGLPTGRYYWSVQTIDTAFGCSEWAPEQTLDVPIPPPAITVTPSELVFSVLAGGPPTLSAAIAVRYDAASGSADVTIDGSSLPSYIAIDETSFTLDANMEHIVNVTLDREAVPFGDPSIPGTVGTIVVTVPGAVGSPATVDVAVDIIDKAITPFAGGCSGPGGDRSAGAASLLLLAAALGLLVSLGRALQRTGRSVS